MSRVAVRAGRDIGVAKDENLAVVGFRVARHGAGVAIVARLGNGESCTSRFRVRDGMRRVAVRADRGIEVAAAHDLLAMNGILVVGERFGVTASAQGGDLPAQLGGLRRGVLVRYLGNFRMARGARQRAMHAASELVGLREQRVRLSIGAGCRKSRRAVAPEAGRAVNMSALSAGGVNRAENK